MIDEMNSRLDELNDKFGEMTQTINSHSQSVASLEAQAELIADILDREEEELQSQPVANPNEHYMVYESTYPEQAITTLRSEEVVENHVEERKEEKKEEEIEAPHDLLREKYKEVSAEASSPSILIPEAPYELRALIPGNLKISFLDIGDTLPIISSYDLLMYKFNCTRQLHESIVIEWMCKCECRTHRESVLLKINFKMPKLKIP
jgi:hypothetical protein